MASIFPFISLDFSIWTEIAQIRSSQWGLEDRMASIHSKCSLKEFSDENYLQMQVFANPFKSFVEMQGKKKAMPSWSHHQKGAHAMPLLWS